MAPQPVDRFLEGLKIHLQNQQINKQRELEGQRIQVEKEAEQGRIEQQKADLKERQRQFDIATKAAQALHALHTASETQKLSEGIMGGVPVPGDQVSPAASSTPGGEPNFTPINPQQATHQVHTLPIQDSNGNPIQVTLPTPETAVRLAADRQRVAGAPAEEAKVRDEARQEGIKTREQAAAQQAETERQIAVGHESALSKLQELREVTEREYEMQSRRDAAAMARTRLEMGSRMTIAKLNLTGGLSAEGGPSGFPVDKILQQVATGQLSLEQIKQEYPKQATALIAAATNAGSLPITKDEQEKLKGYEQFAQVVPIIAQMNNIRNQSSTNALVPMTDAYNQYKALHESLLTKVPALVKILSGRFNQQEMDAYIKGLEPSRAIGASQVANYNKFKNYVKDAVQDMFNTNFSRLPPAQRDMLRDNLGLNNLPYLGNVMTKPGEAAEVTPGVPTKAKTTDWSKYYNK